MLEDLNHAKKHSLKPIKYAIEKVKGAANAKVKIAQHIAEVADADDKRFLLITHADCLAEAEKLRDTILASVPFETVIMGNIGPIVGSCVGPGTVIAFCFGKEVTIVGGDE